MSAVRRIAVFAALALGLMSVLGAAAPREIDRRIDPRQIPELPSHVRAVEPAVIGLRIEVPPDRPSSRTLGTERWGSGIVVDPAGYALTVSYVLLDASRVEATMRDGRTVPARLVGLDLEVGIGVVKLEGAGPWPTAALGDSGKVAAKDAIATVGLTEDGRLSARVGNVESVRPFAAAWEYMLDRAFVVSPYNPAFGGAALVDTSGSVVGITSLRLGEAPYVNLAIPIESFLPGKDEVIARGRVTSRPPRPWLGIYTAAAEQGGVLVSGLSPVGPARAAGFQPGDVIVKLNGEKVESQEDFYRQLWRGSVGQELHVVVQRESGFQAITVRPADRYSIYRTTR